MISENLGVAFISSSLLRTDGGVRLILPMLLLALGALGCRAEEGTLELSVVDAVTGEITPARVEILDAQGEAHVADEALRVAGDCGWYPVHNWVGWIAQVQMAMALQASVHNPFTGTEQFYVDRPISAELMPGRYRVRAYKGTEYEVATQEVEIQRGQSTELRLELSRWINLPEEGWHSADDHLHIARPHRRFDRRIAKWMQAEDLHVANLLQMGFSNGMHITPQYGFGEQAVHRDGSTLLATGQENPRTHVLGHSIILGARNWIDFPDAYLSYDRFWRAAQRQGAIKGYAHWGLAGADEGLAVWAPKGWIDFVEVLGFGFLYPALWYEMVNLGLRVTPTAGTDYPCGPNLPGRDRFYTHIDGKLRYSAWIEAVRSGRTFVTNGPALSLSIDGAIVGDELRLQQPRTVIVEGRVRFDPKRDDVRLLELVGAGDVLFSTGERSGPGEIRLRVTRQVNESTWFALRASGEKVDETPIHSVHLLEEFLTYLDWSRSTELLEGDRRAVPRNGCAWPSAAHTAPIYVTVEGTTPIGEQPRARDIARAWMARVDELEARFSDHGIDEMAGFPGRGDGVDAEELRQARAALLRTLEEARALYRDWAAEQGGGE